jgi:hypothetical protein
LVVVPVWDLMYLFVKRVTMFTVQNIWMIWVGLVE